MMNRRILLAAMLATTVVPAPAQQPPKAGPDPVATIKAYYNAKPGWEEGFYSRRLRALYAAASKKSKELDQPVSGIDFAPAISGQDADDDFRKTLKLTLGEHSGTFAKVKAVFMRFKTDKAETRVDYTLVIEGTAWKIDEIENPAKNEEGWVFSKLLEAGAKGG